MEKVTMNLNISDKDLSEYANSLFNSIQNDSFYPLLKKEGWTDKEIKDNVTKFKEYLDDMHKASKIKTYADCLKYNMTSRTILVRNGKVIERSYLPLDPYKDHSEYMDSFVYADFGDVPEDASLKNVQKTIKSAIRKAMLEHRRLYLYGASRTGKSYSALAFLNWVYKNKKDEHPTFAFLNCAKRISELGNMNYKKKDDFESLIEDYSNVDYLVLDGFGNEFKTDFIRDGVVYRILSARYSKDKFTIFTSNFKLKEVAELYELKSGRNLISSQLYTLLQDKVKNIIDCGSLPLY